MNPRTRTYLLVALAAVGAAALVVGTVAFTRTSTPSATAQTQTTATPSGRAPALVLDLGVRTDPEAVALRRANQLYSSGKRAAAARIFTRYPSLPAQVGAAVGLFSKAKPALAFSRLGPLAPRFPRSQSVRFHLGELLLWIGQLNKAGQELRLAYGEGKTTLLGRTSREFLAQLQAK